MKSLPAGFLARICFACADDLDDLLAEASTREVGAHAFQHDLLVDVDHVGVAHLAAVDDVGHLHARLQFVALRVHGEDADLAGLHVVGDRGGKIGQRTRRQILQHEGLERRAHASQFV